MGDPGFTRSEMMIAAAARELAGQRGCFVGVGLPNIAVNLAKRTVAPDLELVYEAGVFGAQPARLPLSIGDPTIVTGSTAAVSMWELFAFYLQGGLVDVGFLGAAQIDRFGNINTTVIGDYAHPKTRLPGSGGACEIAINAKQIFVIMRQSSRSFVERIDFRTSPGNLGGAENADRIRREQGWLGRGPSVVVTDLGVWHFDETGEMPAAEWTAIFAPTDETGEALAPEALPLLMAIANNRPVHSRMCICGLDHVTRHVEVTAFPLVGVAGRCLGAVALFWTVLAA